MAFQLEESHSVWQDSLKKFRKAVHMARAASHLSALIEGKNVKISIQAL